jgi:hypothetical protein
MEALIKAVGGRNNKRKGQLRKEAFNSQNIPSL